MAGNITFAMLKPGAVEKRHIGAILDKISSTGFRIAAMKMTRISRHEAERFYAVHNQRPFFGELVEYITSGHVVALILEKENAVEDFRKLIGATDPAEAEEGTIRKLYAESKGRNAAHGSDSDENAVIEGFFFFSVRERY